MKRIFGLLAALCLVTLSACFSPWSGGGEGTITIAFGSADRVGRIAVTDNDIEDITHYVTLTGPSGVIEDYFTGSVTATFPVAPGSWTIDIRAKGPRPEGYHASFPDQMLRAVGSGQAAVQAGRDAPAVINMTSAAEVATNKQLSSAMSLARTDGREKIIFITGNITEKNTYAIPAGANIRLVSDSGTRMISAVNASTHAQLYSAINQARTDGGKKIIFITGDIEAVATYAIPAGANITLASASDEPVEIARGGGYDGVMFDVTRNSTLTLGRPGMTGDITITGVTWPARPAASAPIINVSGARLIMRQGITLTGNLGNSTIEGGAVRVGEDGIFSMHGGVISNNRAAHGGGVYVDSEAAGFMKTGGVIYGSGAGVPSGLANTAFGPAGVGGDTGRGNALALPVGTASTYTFNGTVRGTPAEPLIWPLADRPSTGEGAFSISFASFHEMEPIQGPTIAADGTATLSLQDPAQYDPGSIVWFMDGDEIRGGDVTGTNRETLRVGPSLHGGRVMTHFVTVEVGRNGRSYSQVIALEVVPSTGQ